MMRKLIVVVILFVLPSLCAVADDSYPLTLRPLGRIAGTMLPADDGGTSWYVVEQRSVWDMNAPSLRTIDAEGRQQHHVHSGMEIRAAIPLKDGIAVVIREEGQQHWLVVFDGTLREHSRCRLEGTGPTVEIGGRPDGGVVYVSIGGTLTACTVGEGTITARVLDDRISGLLSLNGRDGLDVAYVHPVGTLSYLTILDTTQRVRTYVVVPMAPQSRLEQVGTAIVVYTPIDDVRGTQITIVDPATSRSQFLTVDVPPPLITSYMQNGQIMSAVVRLQNGRYDLCVTTLRQLGTLASIDGETINGAYGRPLLVRYIADSLVICCTGGILAATAHGEVLSSDTLTVDGEATHLTIHRHPAGFVIAGAQGSIIIARDHQIFWRVIRFGRDVLTYVVPILMGLGLLLMLSINFRQRRLLAAMMELPGAGLVVHLDANGRLLRTNDRAAQLLKITSSVPMRRLFRTYALHDGVGDLLDFVNQVQSIRTAVSDKVVIADGEASREYVFSAVPLRGAFGRYNGCVITGVDITEALERRRIVNWAQLAHDMQTNLSTIRLNAEQLDTDGNDVTRERRRRILFQVGVLIQRVRDLVSVGRSEDLDRMPVHSAELCTEIRHEFDPTVFPHVTFSMKLRGTMMNVDRLKISRAVRNAVENGIKAMRGQPGTIEIATWFDRTNVYVRVSDTGAGMDDETMTNMMKPFFTTSKDGSGTGIGTMIMQHVMHQHGGSLRVTSEVGKGTQVIFRIPHGMEGPRLRNAQFAVTDEEPV